MTSRAEPLDAVDLRGPITGSTAAVVGLQWGDEGKGKIIDVLAGGFDAVVRYNGGANAGHSVVIGGERFAVHLVPSGIFHPGVAAIIGNGCVVDPWLLVEEARGLAERGIDVGGLALSSRAHLVLPHHKLQDAHREAWLATRDASIGTTKRGIGPTYADKANRSSSLRVGHLLDGDRLRDRVEAALAEKRALLGDDLGADGDAAALTERLAEVGRELEPWITDTTYLLHGLLRSGGRVLFEGANATLLDVDHGTFPFVTSSNCSALGIPAGTGVPGRLVDGVVGVLKAYSTRVGAGAFPTELEGPTAERIRERGREYGTTTGRPRRCGWLDLVAVRYAAMLNGGSCLALTLLDVLGGFDELRICTAYRLTNGSTTERFLPDALDLEDVEPAYETLPGFDGEVGGLRERDALPAAARRYVDRIEEIVGVPVGIVSVGPDRDESIIARDRLPQACARSLPAAG